MVTILPIDADEDLVREGLGLAIAGRMRAAIEVIGKQASELAAGGVIDRFAWENAFGTLEKLYAAATPHLEYVRAFADQWPDEPEADEDGNDPA